MFRSGNFYVEFQFEVTQDLRESPYVADIPKTFQRVSKKINLDNGMHKTTKTDFQILAGKDGSRVYRKTLKAKNPEVLYQNGEYYNFFQAQR